jgi:PrcB C-terminal
MRETFTSQDAFRDFLRKAMPGRRLRVPTIDWSQREAILVAAGPRSSTGYALEIVSVRQRGGRLVVTVHERTPSLGEPVQAKVTYPYRLITIPRTPGRLLLHFEGRP